MSFVAANAIVKTFDFKPVLRGISIQFEAGQVYKIEGENGAGKSTLLRIVSGLSFPDSGSVQVSNLDLSQTDSFEKIKKDIGIGYLDSHSQLYSHLNLKENISLFAALNDVRKEELDALLVRLNLTSFLNLMPAECSSGVLKKFSILKTIMHRPKLLILDEPFVHLDQSSIAMVKDIIVDFAKNNDACVIYVSHHQVELEHRTFTLKEGVINESL